MEKQLTFKQNIIDLINHLENLEGKILPECLIKLKQIGIVSEDPTKFVYEFGADCDYISIYLENNPEETIGYLKFYNNAHQDLPINSEINPYGASKDSLVMYDYKLFLRDVPLNKHCTIRKKHLINEKFLSDIIMHKLMYDSVDIENCNLLYYTNDWDYAKISKMKKEDLNFVKSLVSVAHQKNMSTLNHATMRDSTYESLEKYYKLMLKTIHGRLEKCIEKAKGDK